jgi:protein SCO1
MKTMKARIAILALAASTTGMAGGTAHAAPKGSPWDEKHFGNPVLVTQDGKEVKLYDDLIKDKLVVFSFIYTHCTKQCGLITASLARVQRELGDRLGKDIYFYSVSIDPERDPPEVLKRYAAAFHARPGWTFLTGKKADVVALRKRFGDMNEVEAHSANLVIGNDRTGNWFATGALDNPKYLAMVIGDWLDPDWGRRKPAASYADAPTKISVDRVEVLYRDKCYFCHNSGTEAVGPSLQGVVARRGEGWVKRWLTEPEKVLSEKDPAVAEMVSKYGGVVMPNPELDPGQVAALMVFLKEYEPARAARKD